MKTLIILLATAMTALTAPLHYKANSATAKNMHIVFIANDHEYRSEETCPALARILTLHHGFDTTVLFGIDEQGHIKAGSNNMPGTDVLKNADLLIIFARFLDLPDAQMKPIHDYLQRGCPVIGLRTSTHAFKIESESAYKQYDFRNKDQAYKGGFGHQILGQSWVGHYGKNHKQSTRIDLVESKKSHPILTGVKDAWVHAGGYNAEPQPDWEILATAQPLLAMKPTGEDDPKKPAMAGHWTRNYTTADGKKHRVVTSLYGASEDIQNEGYRRLLINSTFWALGLENQITPTLRIDLISPYNPTTFKFQGEVKGIFPSDYTDPKSPIPAKK